MAYQLRPYQQAAVDAVLTHFRHSDEAACVVLPTGAGKSLVIARLAQLARGRLLVLAHVKELCAQNHRKVTEAGVKAGLFSAGLKEMDASERITFASIQSAARNLDKFDGVYSLVIIDECHRVGAGDDTQYNVLLSQLRRANANLKVLGLTATPYRLDLGWVYQHHYRGFVRSEEPRPFTRCVFEMTLGEMLSLGFLTPPKLVDAPIAEYDFSAMDRASHGGKDGDSATNLSSLLARHKRVTEAIAEQLVELAKSRRGVMIFAASVEHAKEIAGYLGAEETALVLGETTGDERDAHIERFRTGAVKFLINVSVLTTGFDVPHVDLIAILRPTQSVSLFQQIVGRGLRLFKGKADCLVIDYAGNGFSVFQPEVSDDRPERDTVPVSVSCPDCAFVNTFWGRTDASGHVVEHFGRRCQGLVSDAPGRRLQCSYRFRFKECPQCGSQNDIAARVCGACQQTLVDADDQLKAALGLKDARVLRVAGVTTRSQGAIFIVSYHDEDGASLDERFDLSSAGQRGAFLRIFGARVANGERLPRNASAETIAASTYRPPDFVIARKAKRFWRVQARLFDYEGRRRKANALY